MSARLLSARLLAAFALTAGALGCTAVAAEPPASVARAICRPSFLVEGKALAAGTAFVVDTGGEHPRALLVTADHLFGPNGGLETQIPWTEMAAKVTAVRCRGLVNTGEVWRGGPALTIPDAHPVGPDGALRDVAAFPLDAPATGPQPVHLKLAAQPPKRGDSVWLLAQVLKGAPATQLLHHAVVTYSRDDALEYAFDNPALVIQATSGAPVLNADGEVVGVNLAGGVHDGVFKAAGDSLAGLRSALEAAQ